MCNNAEELLSCQCECQHPLVIAQVSLHVDNGMLIALGKDNGKGLCVAGMKMGVGGGGVGGGYLSHLLMTTRSWKDSNTHGLDVHRK